MVHGKPVQNGELFRKMKKVELFFFFRQKCGIWMEYFFLWSLLSLFFPPHFHFNFMDCKSKTSLQALDAHLLLRVHISRDPQSFQSVNRRNPDIPVLDGDSWQSQIGSKLAPLQLFELFSCSSSSVHHAFSPPISFPSHSVYVRPMSVLRFSSLSHGSEQWVHPAGVARSTSGAGYLGSHVGTSMSRTQCFMSDGVSLFFF